MAEKEITTEEIAAVYPKVAQIIADALGVDVEVVTLDVPLIEGLDAESIDFLDLVFRLERGFGVKIPRGQIVEHARGDLSETEFEQKGLVTEVGLKRLREFLSEVPADRFRDETHGKARQMDGDGVAPCRTRARFQRRDPIDERKRAEPLGHEHLAPPVSPRLARRAARARPPCRRFLA